MKVMSFKCSDLEAEMIKNSAADEAVSVAEYIRRRTLNESNLMSFLQKQKELEQRINLRFLSIEKKLNDVLFNSRIGAQIAQAIIQNVNPENAEKIVDKIFSEVEKMESEGEK